MKPPRYIYLQCYDDDGELLDIHNDDVTWCWERMNETDAEYILVDKDTYWTLMKRQIAELIESERKRRMED